MHVVVPYMKNTLYSTNKYSCVRPVHTLYISYFIEHKGRNEPSNYSVRHIMLCLRYDVHLKGTPSNTTPIPACNPLSTCSLKIYISTEVIANFPFSLTEMKSYSDFVRIFVLKLYIYIYTEWPKKIYTLFTHQYFWNKFKWNFYFRVRV